MDDILKVTGLNKSYDNFSLKDVSFTLPEGCITGFIGVNGAGKTTTLRSILGLTSRISGHINFFGMDIEKDARKIKDRIGVVLDDGCFYDELSLAEMKDVIASAYSAWSERDFKESSMKAKTCHSIRQSSLLPISCLLYTSIAGTICAIAFMEYGPQRPDPFADEEETPDEESGEEGKEYEEEENTEDVYKRQPFYLGPVKPRVRPASP